MKSTFTPYVSCASQTPLTQSPYLANMYKAVLAQSELQAP